MADHIQVGDATPRVQYVANGSQTAFTFLFPIFTAADMEVWLGSVRQPVTAYTISGVGISGGGTVLFAIPPADGTLVTLRRRLAIARTSDYQDDGVIRAKVLNDEMDYQTAALQQVADDAGRAVKRSVISASSADLTLPEPSAGKAIKWNAVGNGLENSAGDMDQVVAAATAQAAAAAASAAAAAADRASAAADKATTQAYRDAAATSAAVAATASGGVKISATDTAADYLLDALVAGGNITLTRNNPGANETLSIAVSGLGTAAALAADSDGTLAADSDARLPTQKAIRTYVAANAGVSSAEFTALQQDVIQNYLLDAVNGAWAAGSCANGGFDAFTADTIGANSTNQTYEAGKYYDNPPLAPSASYANAGGSGARGDIVITHSSGWHASSSFALCDGTTAGSMGTLVVSGTAVAGMWVQFDFGAGAAKYFSQFKRHYDTASTGVDTWKWQGSNDAASWSDMTAAAVWGGGVAVTDTVGGNYGPWRYVRHVGVSGNSSQASWNAEMDFSIGTTAGNRPDMTLVSHALSPAPAAAPTQVKLMVLYKAVDAAVLNTDFTAEASRDGSAWSPGALADTGLTIGGFKALWTVIDVGGQPAGTTAKYRLKALNGKTQQVKGVALMTR
ncbi:MAG: hypothetical protein EPN20_01015 [Magnetospirillum sp.]|nr:MAG: hypothetical protein EPN20_01015 [Magnetospirillum sp.]